MSKFDYFIIFAGMRTGSNFLETNLNAFPSLTCYGEAFNPHFIGYPNKDNILGLTMDQRDNDPNILLNVIKNETHGLGGFRYFFDHDARILDTILDDPRAAKIILTRNPVESYVSLKIAQETGQWKLTNVKRAKQGVASFDKTEFQSHLEHQQKFQIDLMNALQIRGQSAFYIDYDDLNDLDVINGLARFLGQPDQLDKLDTQLKKQNPKPLSDKVENFDAMQDALSEMDVFNLSRTPNFEPRRGAVVPTYVASRNTGLLYLPVRSGPEAAVVNWLAAVDQCDTDQLLTGFTQKTLRQWKRKFRAHRGFTVLRHPVSRVHHAFCTRILMDGPDCFTDVRHKIRNGFKVPLPGKIDQRYTVDDHKEAFIGFLGFLKQNLAGQTNLRIDPAWGSQAQTVKGFSQVAPADIILRENELSALLPMLALQVGVDAPPDYVPIAPDYPFQLNDIYDEEIEAAVEDLYNRDYVVFGFQSWDNT